MGIHETLNFTTVNFQESSWLSDPSGYDIEHTKFRTASKLFYQDRYHSHRIRARQPPNESVRWVGVGVGVGPGVRAGLRLGLGLGPDRQIHCAKRK